MTAITTMTATPACPVCETVLLVTTKGHRCFYCQIRYN
jgi:hypothetical protein